MSTKIAKVLTNDVHLISLLAEMESCRLNEIPKHKVSIYRNGKNYNIICDHEHKKYKVEINNGKSGEDCVDNTYEFDFGFEVQLLV